MDETTSMIRGVFAEEARELVAEIEKAVVRLTEQRDATQRRAAIEAVFRATHTLKGAAGSVGLGEVEGLAHTLETVLMPFRDGSVVAPPPLLRGVLRVLDTIPRHVDSCREVDDEPSLNDARTLLQRLAAGEKVVEPLPTLTADDDGRDRTSTRRKVETSGSESEMLRIPLERISRLDARLDAFRELRGSLLNRVRDAQRLLVNLDSTIASGDTEMLKSLRAMASTSYRTLSAALTEFDGNISDFEDELRVTRLVSFDSVTQRISRAVWEHSESVSKPVRFEVHGPALALDRRVLEELKEMLIHLVRNSIDHGIESKEQRKAAKKSETGSIRLTSSPQGQTVLMTLEDDGQGIDVARVKKVAVDRKIISPAQAEVLSQSDAYELLFAAGFSTASTVSMTSGRGVGLDVVREKIRRLGGRITVTSERGKGTKFELDVPISLATEQVLLVQISGFQLAFPISAVERSFRVDAATAAGLEVTHRGQPLSVRKLSTMLGLPDAGVPERQTPVVVVSAGGRLAAFAVDRMLGEREVVTRPLPTGIVHHKHLSSAMSLGDGSLVFMLNVAWLLGAQLDTQVETKGTLRHRILVADDSVTTRAVHRQTLLKAGFDVETAADGEEAFRTLSTRGAELVVSDVRMPNLDGLGLARRIRSSQRFRTLPVILISSLDADTDRERAVQAGASVYITKGEYQPSELVRVVRQLLGLSSEGT